MIELLIPYGLHKYDTWRILSLKCYIGNSMCLRSCIRNVNKHFWHRCRGSQLSLSVYRLSRIVLESIISLIELSFALCLMPSQGSAWPDLIYQQITIWIQNLCWGNPIWGSPRQGLLDPTSERLLTSLKEHQRPLNRYRWLLLPRSASMTSQLCLVLMSKLGQIWMSEMVTLSLN
jgi:hypothetical protein